jgi:hypothetical protein
VNPLNHEVVREFAYQATEIEMLCKIVGDQLTSDPDTVMAGLAVEGIARLARTLSNDVLAHTEAD